MLLTATLLSLGGLVSGNDRHAVDATIIDHELHNDLSGRKDDEVGVLVVRGEIDAPERVVLHGNRVLSSAVCAFDSDEDVDGNFRAEG